MQVPEGPPMAGEAKAVESASSGEKPPAGVEVKSGGVWRFPLRNIRRVGRRRRLLRETGLELFGSEDGRGLLLDFASPPARTRFLLSLYHASTTTNRDLSRHLRNDIGLDPDKDVGKALPVLGRIAEEERAKRETTRKGTPEMVEEEEEEAIAATGVVGMIASAFTVDKSAQKKAAATSKPKPRRPGGTMHHLHTGPAALTPAEAESILRATEAWQEKSLSNLEYLEILNEKAGRSLNDLSQYPVMPWVLADYTSSSLNLDDPKTFRNLAKPVGALEESRLTSLRTRYEAMASVGAERPEEEPFLFGTHYSAPGYVLFFLVRSMAAHMLRLQRGRFDHPDRLFCGVAEAWRGVMSNPADVKELIPEFFRGSGSFFKSPRGLELGTRADGTKVSNVILPPWAGESPEQFIRLHRQALESDYVSDHLHLWIDLIFGFRQRGPKAVEADNVFHPLSYEGPAETALAQAIATGDAARRDMVETHAAEFGQTPRQLFRVPHPKRTGPKLRLVPAALWSLDPSDDKGPSSDDHHHDGHPPPRPPPSNDDRRDPSPKKDDSTKKAQGGGSSKSGPLFSFWDKDGNQVFKDDKGNIVPNPNPDPSSPTKKQPDSDEAHSNTPTTTNEEDDEVDETSATVDKEDVDDDTDDHLPQNSGSSSPTTEPQTPPNSSTPPKPALDRPPAHPGVPKGQASSSSGVASSAEKRRVAVGKLPESGERKSDEDEEDEEEEDEEEEEEMSAAARVAARDPTVVASPALSKRGSSADVLGPSSPGSRLRSAVSAVVAAKALDRAALVRGLSDPWRPLRVGIPRSSLRGPRSRRLALAALGNSGAAEEGDVSVRSKQASSASASPAESEEDAVEKEEEEEESGVGGHLRPEVESIALYGWQASDSDDDELFRSVLGDETPLEKWNAAGRGRRRRRLAARRARRVARAALCTATRSHGSSSDEDGAGDGEVPVVEERRKAGRVFPSVLSVAEEGLERFAGRRVHLGRVLAVVVLGVDESEESKGRVPLAASVGEDGRLAVLRATARGGVRVAAAWTIAGAPPTSACAVPGAPGCVLVGTRAGSIGIVDASTGRVIAAVSHAHQGAVGAVTCCTFRAAASDEKSTDKVVAVSGGADGLVATWTVQLHRRGWATGTVAELSQEPAAVCREHGAPLTVLAANQGKLCSGDAAGTIVLSRIEPSGHLAPVAAHDALGGGPANPDVGLVGITAATWSPDAAHVVCGTVDGRVAVFSDEADLRGMLLAGEVVLSLTSAAKGAAVLLGGSSADASFLNLQPVLTGSTPENPTKPTTESKALSPRRKKPLALATAAAPGGRDAWVGPGLVLKRIKHAAATPHETAPDKRLPEKERAEAFRDFAAASPWGEGMGDWITAVGLSGDDRVAFLGTRAGGVAVYHRPWA